MVAITAGLCRPMLNFEEACWSRGSVTSGSARLQGLGMGGRTSTTEQVFRQRSSLGLAAVCAVTGVILLVSLARNWADYPRPVYACWVVFALAVTWSIFVRPAVLLEVNGVTVRNVLRDVHIPWTQLTGVTSRWNLKVFAGDRGYTAWAISSQVERPRRGSGAVLGKLSPRRLEGQRRADAARSLTVPKVTAVTVASSIQQAKREYDEAVALGQLPEVPDGRVRISWASQVMIVLLLPVIAVIALSVV